MVGSFVMTPISVLEAPMWILIFYALLLFLAGVRSALRSMEHFYRRELVPGFAFWALSLAWLVASGALAMVALPG